MNAPLRLHERMTRHTARLLLGLALWLGSASFADAQTCDITATPSSPFSGQAFTLCGPAGAGLSYSWYDSMGNPLGEQQCLGYSSGLPSGTYDWTLIVAGPNGMSICPYELMVTAAPPPPPPGCDVTVDPAGTICGGQAFTLCAPLGTGQSYAWYQDTDLVSTDRCLMVSAGRPPGTWNYAVVVTQGGQSSRCPVSVVVTDCARRTNCPRPAAFWTRQCVRMGNRRTQLSNDQMNALASNIDSRSAFFTWTSASSAPGSSSLCWVLGPPRPMDARKQAKRQFAALLANVAAGELNMITRNGESISLEPSTAISCGGASTIAGLIAATDVQLAQLESRPLSDRAVTAAYRGIQDCCERINRGQGIGEVCPATVHAEQEAEADGDPDGEASMLTPSPNPFSTSTQIDYEVGSAGERVDVGIYDVAGRLVQTLARGWQSSGTYSLRWDGRDASGVRAKAGVFFVRGTIGDRPIAARLLLLR